MSILMRIARALSLTKDEATIVIVGLDDSGKSSIINHLKMAKQGKGGVKGAGFEATPTVGFQEEKFSASNINFSVFDMSGQSRYRNLWESYYRDADAIIFVVDSSDRLRVCVAKEELDNMMSHEDFQKTNIPLLVFANKMDISGALSAEQCVEELEMDKIVERPWQLVSSNGVTGVGLDVGVAWLSDSIKPTIRRRHSSLPGRNSRK